MEERFETFTVLINRISRNIRKIKNQDMAEHNLKSAHVSCLYYLYSTGGLSATELCEHCEEDKATISRALDFLETKGYLTCESKHNKRYKSPLVLTEKGYAAGKRIADKISCVLKEIKWSTDEERLAFYQSLAVISDSLEAVIKKQEVYYEKKN